MLGLTPPRHIPTLPIISVNTLRVHVRFGEAAMVGWTAQMGALSHSLSIGGFFSIFARRQSL